MRTGDAAPAPTALDAVLAALRCPTCGAPLARLDHEVVCAAGHRFDIARQGYLNLAVGRRHPGTGDSPAMVLAREAFLSTGNFAPIAEAVREVVLTYLPRADGLVVDLAGGTGYYLAQTLTALPDRFGVCVELSPAALRRAARRHVRLAAVGADVWQRLPVADQAAATVLSVFGPRNADEVTRVLAPQGVLVTVSPLPDHLAELRDPLGLIGIDPDKTRRRATQFAAFARVEQRAVRVRLELAPPDAVNLVAMGPTARHVHEADLAERVARLGAPVRATASVVLAVYRRP